MSNEFIPNVELFGNLKDKVVVISGGASGIGASTVRLLHSLGANIVIGDHNIVSAKHELLASLSPTHPKKNVHFLPMDVLNYQHVIMLFRTARQMFGRVDHAIACAGIADVKDGLSDLTTDSVDELEACALRQQFGPSTKILNVNVVGTYYFMRVAAIYLKEYKVCSEKSITLLSSLAGFIDGGSTIALYQASKHAILGLMRSVHKSFLAEHGIRVNTVCPSVTDTPMAKPLLPYFRNNNVAVNTPEDVARVLAGIMTTASMSGGAVFVGESRAWEFQEGLNNTLPLWLGKEAVEGLVRAKEALSKFGFKESANGQ